jgi:hypothetical protein
MMADDKKTKDPAPKKEPAAESRGAAAAPKTEGAKTEGVKADGAKTETAKTETAKAESAKSESANADAAPSRKGMGEGQKPVSQAYKDNWNAIFGKKKTR